MPYLRNIILASSIEGARQSGELDPGVFNAITTYLTAALEVQLNGMRRASKTVTETQVLDFLQKNFDSSVQGPAQLTYANINDGSLPIAPLFQQRINRINMTRLYFAALRQLASDMPKEEVDAMAALFDALVDENDIVELLGCLCNPALPAVFHTEDSHQRQNLLSQISSSGEFIQRKGSLTPHQLSTLFHEAQHNPILAMALLEVSNGKLSGTVFGTQGANVSMLVHQGNLNQTLSLDEKGSFSLNVLPAGNWTLIPQGKDHAFEPAYREINSSGNETIPFMDFHTHPNLGRPRLQPTQYEQSLIPGYYEGLYLSGAANLRAENLLHGVNILGVTGNHFSFDGRAATGMKGHLLMGYRGYAALGWVEGIIPEHPGLQLSGNIYTSQYEAGYYPYVIMQGSANLKSENLRTGINIYGIQGGSNIVDSSSARVEPSALLVGRRALAEGAWVSGNLPQQNLSPNSTTLIYGLHESANLSHIEADLTSKNLRSGVEVFGIQGHPHTVDTRSGNASPSQLLEGYTGYAAGNITSGTLKSLEASPHSPLMETGIYPSTNLQMIDTDLSPENIRSGIKLFGVEGHATDTSSANALAEHLMEGSLAHARGQWLWGSLPRRLVSANATLWEEGYHASGNLLAIDLDLRPQNIHSGANIFGILGSPTVIDSASGNISTTQIAPGKSAYANGSIITGSPALYFDESHTQIPNGYVSATDLVTIDSDLFSQNIKAGVNVFGVVGNASIVDTSSGNALAEHLLQGAVAWVDGQEVTGALNQQTPTPTSHLWASGVYAATNLVDIDPDLHPANLRAGTTIFGLSANHAKLVDSSSANGGPGDLLDGFHGWSSGTEVIGTLPSPVLSSTNMFWPSGNVSANILTNIEPDLHSNHIKSGSNLFGIIGANAHIVDTSSGNALPSHLLQGSTAWVDGTEITGTLPLLQPIATSPTWAAGISYGGNLVDVDPDLHPDNIKVGVSIFGVTGSNTHVVDTSSGNLSANHLVLGYRAWTDGTEIVGTLPHPTPDAHSSYWDYGYTAGVNLNSLEVDLQSGQLRYGSNIFGVVGSNPHIVDTASGNASAANLLSGYRAWVNGNELTGTLPNVSFSGSNTILPAGNHSAFDLSTLAPGLLGANILAGVNIFGVVGDLAVVDSAANTDRAPGALKPEELLAGSRVWVSGNEIVGTFEPEELPQAPPSQITGSMNISQYPFQIYTDYCIIDISGGPSASTYPVTFTNRQPDLTGADNLQYKTTKIVLKRVPAGSFTMGGVESATQPLLSILGHPVTISRDFWAGVFEMTQTQWLNVMGSFPNPQSFNNSGTQTDPVTNISFEDIRGITSSYDWPTVKTVGPNTFMGNLRAKTGLMLDLPTEAQWEYTCRAGTTTHYSYGDTPDGDYMWYNANNSAVVGTKEVGAKLPNPWGFYDMHGNVWEKCLDYGTPTYHYYWFSPVLDPVGPISGTERILRGGRYAMPDFAAYSTSRGDGQLTSFAEGSGFRVFMSDHSESTALPPSNLTVTTGNTMLGVVWDEIAGADNYTLYWGLTGGLGLYSGNSVTVTGNTHIVSGLSNGANISFTVGAHVGGVFTGGCAEVTGAADAAGGDYLVVDVSAGPTATHYPVTIEVSPDLTGASNLQYKTDKIVLKRIGAGSFTMGSPETEVGRGSNEHQHTVNLSQDIYMGVFELTQQQWLQVMGSYTGGQTHHSDENIKALHQVSWEDVRGSAAAGANWPNDGSTVSATSLMGQLRAKTGLKFDLPTEAQWEYACRAGTTTALSNGTPNVSGTSVGMNDPNLTSIAWYDFNSGGIHEVGELQPNPHGLYDIHGNIFEMCLDWYVIDISSYSLDPVGPTSGTYRTCRGGDWSWVGHGCRSAQRMTLPPTGRGNNVGLRLSLTSPSAPSTPSAPTALTLTAGNSMLAVSWEATAGVDNTALFWSESSGHNLLASSNTATVTGNTFIITGVSNGTTIYVAAQFSTGGNLSFISSPVSAAPTGLGGDHLLIDVSAGPTATHHPVSIANLSASDLTGASNLQYKTGKIVLKRIPAGSFTMGSPVSELGRGGDEAEHTVVLNDSYFMGVFELTRAQYLNIMASNPTAPSFTNADNTLPMDSVSYEDLRGVPASGYDWPNDSHALDPNGLFGKLQSKTGLTFDLPTEAQWEYTTRAGSTGALNDGTADIAGLGANVDDANLKALGWYDFNAGVSTQEVGGKAPNTWGLYDTHGNVSEWVLDWYVSDITALSSDPTGPASGSTRNIRGGGYSGGAQDSRSAERQGFAPNTQANSIGLRLCLPKQP
jgi:formylglycine-generating enzyme required for sulfatase activity